MTDRAESEQPAPAAPGRMTRRLLILGAVAGLTIVGFGVTFDWENLRRWLLRRNLTKHFWYLRHDRASMDQFIDAFEDKIHVMGRHPKVLLGNLPERVYLSYLASSDYFENGEDESKTLQFVSLWYPMVNICTNPFTKRLLPAGEENPY